MTTPTECFREWEKRETLRVLNEVLNKERLVIEGEAYFKELRMEPLCMEKGKIFRFPVTLEVFLKTDLGSIEEYEQLQRRFREGKCRMIIEEIE